jgi:Ribonucleotide reductase, small chain
VSACQRWQSAARGVTCRAGADDDRLGSVAPEATLDPGGRAATEDSAMMKNISPVVITTGCRPKFRCRPISRIGSRRTTSPEDERHAIKRNLGFFAASESLVANNIVLAIYRHLTNPECRQYLLRQAMRGRQQAANAVDVRHRPRPGGSGQHTGDARVDKRSIRGKAGSRQLFANSC